MKPVIRRLRRPGHLLVLFTITFFLSLVMLSAPASVMGADLEMDDQFGGSGAQVVFSISVNSAPNAVTSLGIEIEYCEGVLDYSGAEFAGTLIEGWAFKDVSNPSAGILRLGGFDLTGFAAGASGSLVKLTFDVIGDQGCSLPLGQLKNDIAGWTIKDGSFSFVDFAIYPPDASMCLGAYATFAVVPEDMGVAPFSWRVDGDLVQEGDSPTFKFRSTEAASYTVSVQDSSIPSLEAQATATFWAEDDSGALDIPGGSGSSGTEMVVPVRVQDAPNQVAALGFDLFYDTAKLTYVGYSRGDLTEEFDFFDVNLIETGTVRCGGFEAGANKIPVGASGTVVNLTFSVAEDLGDCVSSLLEIGSVTNHIADWDISGGCFLLNCGCDGDVNGDGQITPLDALCAFETYMLICPTTCGIPCEEVCCDVNQDDRCTPADALCIFQKYMEVPSCLD